MLRGPQSYNAVATVAPKTLFPSPEKAFNWAWAPAALAPAALQHLGGALVGEIVASGHPPATRNIGRARNVGPRLARVTDYALPLPHCGRLAARVRPERSGRRHRRRRRRARHARQGGRLYLAVAPAPVLRRGPHGGAVGGGAGADTVGWRQAAVVLAVVLPAVVVVPHGVGFRKEVDRLHAGGAPPGWAKG
eukprot:scaffold98808_cov69-Phaeocystis_antarctica.AAC.3